MTETERAVLAGGCFWGMQDLIRKLPGVEKTRVGYTGGEVLNATYRNHEGHAEAIEISLIPIGSAIVSCSNSSSRSMTRRRRTGRATTGLLLPLGDLYTRRNSGRRRCGQSRT